MRCILLILVIIVVTEASSWNDVKKEVGTINSIPDIVIRNFRITDSYYRIGHKFQEMLGTAGTTMDEFELVWPTLATWASNSVGISIRKQIPPHFLDSVLSFFPKALRAILKKFGNRVAQSLFNKMLTKTSQSLGVGNQQVYDNVANHFADFGIYYSTLSSPDRSTNAQYNKTFDLSTELDSTMIEAMQFYYRAMFANSTVIKAQYICAANALVGLAEQTFLQDAIVGAFPGNITFNVLGFKYRFDPGPIITRYLIALVFSNELLEADHDVPLRPWSKTSWPRDLVTLIPEVKQLYLKFVPQTTSLKGTAASSWLRLADRMKFVVPLFRSRQDDTFLYTCPPFTPSQLSLIYKGVQPDESKLCLSANCCTREFPILRSPYRRREFQ